MSTSPLLKNDDENEQPDPIYILCNDKNYRIKIDQDLIPLSAFLSGLRSFDKKESQINLSISPIVLELILRFQRLVVAHNKNVASHQNMGKKSNSGNNTVNHFVSVNMDSLPVKCYTGLSKSSNENGKEIEVKKLEQTTQINIETDYDNRARHLPILTGHNPILCDYVDLLGNIHPHVLVECMKGAHQLLMEPSFSIFECKLQIILFGLSLPMIETILTFSQNPSNNEKMEQHLLEILHLTNKREYLTNINHQNDIFDDANNKNIIQETTFKNEMMHEMMHENNKCYQLPSVVLNKLKKNNQKILTKDERKERISIAKKKRKLETSQEENRIKNLNEVILSVLSHVKINNKVKPYESFNMENKDEFSQIYDECYEL